MGGYAGLTEIRMHPKGLFSAKMLELQAKGPHPKQPADEPESIKHIRRIIREEFAKLVNEIDDMGLWRGAPDYQERRAALISAYAQECAVCKACVDALWDNEPDRRF